MPELPEVESLRRHLESAAIGRTIVGIELPLPRIVRSGSLYDLTGLSIASITRHGKYLTFHLQDRRGHPSPHRLHAHLGMTGTFLFETRERNLDARDDRFVRARIILDRGSLAFRDARTLGGLWESNDNRTPYDDFGPDFFDPGFDADAFVAAVRGRRTPVKLALLDQSSVAGIGNIYASEALFSAGIHPARRASSIGIVRLKRLHKALGEIMTAAIASGGTTFRDFRLSDGREGAFKASLAVYGREGDPCQHCGTAIRRIVQGGRSSFYCPRCQRG
ncbi:MAG: bifunctional DNA-formamidopyrimidine glycosylase/DNA-(apurinic or apyrimidinic site) lyase [Calditrichaeota bacterium]|nr:bifunctional DNA-formamidopyrimidine glycosylase/DNA-(apurinic or apyrimidinic site) lyase [Calditrichota bacterium]